MNRGAVSDYVHYVNTFDKDYNGEIDIEVKNAIDAFLDRLVEKSTTLKGSSKITNYRSGMKKYIHFLLDTKRIS